MAKRKSWWIQLHGVPSAFAGPHGGLRVPPPAVVRFHLLFLAALAVVTGITTQAGLLLVPLGSALLLLCAAGPAGIRQVVGVGRGGSTADPKTAETRPAETQPAEKQPTKEKTVKKKSKTYRTDFS